MRRTEKEIREKIEELMKDAQRIPYILEEREAKYNQIDALLWVINDESGKPI